MIGLIAMALVGCKHPDAQDTGPVLDTGWFIDTGGPVACADRVMSTVPVAGVTDWYRRDAPSVRTGTRATEAYAAEIVDQDGVPVASHVQWVAELPQFDVIPDVPLAPSSSYALAVTDCEGLHFVPFGTSDLGMPLTDGPSALIDAAYAIQLRDATFVTPPGLGTLIALYLDWPVLLGVQFANDDIIDLIGAQGYIAPSGTPRQLLNEPTWDYPLASFADAPYVEAEAPSVQIAASSAVTLTIDNFHLQGTFAADASRLGGAEVSGLADTRNLGPALDLGDADDAVCRAAGSFGVSCIPCPDNQPLCIAIHAVNVTGERINGVSVTRVPQ